MQSYQSEIETGSERNTMHLQYDEIETKLMQGHERTWEDTTAYTAEATGAYVMVWFDGLTCYTSGKQPPERNLQFT